MLEELTKDEVSEVTQILKTFLKPGEYVVIYLRLDVFSEWVQAFYNDGNVVMPYPCVCILNSKIVQKQNPKRFPQ